MLEIKSAWSPRNNHGSGCSCCRWLLLLLLPLHLLKDSPALCERTHTLRYDLTAVSQARSRQPQFWALGYLDGELFLRYDGDSRKAEPWGLRMKGPMGAETWARETEELQEKEQQLRTMLAEVMAQKEQDRGFHTLQATLGCKIQGNNRGGFWRLGYDGQNLLVLDMKDLTWKAENPSAKATEIIWNKHGPSKFLIQAFLNDTCPDQLQRHVTTMRDQMVNTVPTESRECWC